MKLSPRYLRGDNRGKYYLSLCVLDTIEEKPKFELHFNSPVAGLALLNEKKKCRVMSSWLERRQLKNKHVDS